MVKLVTEKITSQPHHQSDSSGDDSVTDDDISGVETTDTEESSTNVNKCQQMS
jgi:hypothetical protein